MPRVAFRTFGCRLNQAETAQLRARFAAAGYDTVPFGAPCDVCVIHTCAVTASAEREGVRAAKAAVRARPAARVIVTGCAARIDGDGLRRETGATVVTDTGCADGLTGIPGGQPTGAPRRNLDGDAAPAPAFDTARAWLKVQDGCDSGCAYCIVPRARGPARSRTVPEVIAEARALADRGHREIVLTGANLGAYRDGRARLPDLLERLEAIDNVGRLRISSIEIPTVEREVIDFMASSRKLCRFIHLPLQTGDDRLLRAMGRRYTSARYRDCVAYLLDRIPRVGLGTDLIAGLPGEDTRAFENTLRMVEDIPFSNLHVFAFSPRPGTRAAAMRARTPTALASRRAGHLKAIGARKREAFARGFVGVAVAVVGEQTLADGTLRGWTGEYLEARLPPGLARRGDLASFTPSRCCGAVLS